MYENPLDDSNTEFNQVLELLEKTNQNVFITGDAGTGKSTLLKYFVENTQKDVVVLAPTGLAAINAGGQTIHKFCLFPPRFVRPEDIQITKNPLQKTLIAELKTIIIDEISMVRADQLDGIDRFLRLNRKNNLPFGGVQMIFVGDLYQLPPVVNREEMAIFNQVYGSPYFFSSNVFQSLEITKIELRKNYRQKEDLEFLEILSKVKKGEVDYQTLSAINSRFVPDHEEFETEGLFLNLATTNQVALQINTTKLAQIDEPNFEYKADLTGDFNERDFAGESSLNLKIGSQVMFIRNDALGRWVNGTMGVIEDLGTKKVIVRTEKGFVHEVAPEKWENIKFVFDEDEGQIIPKPVGTLKQYPLKLAWAVTIHKSQGQTFDRVLIDLDRGAFSHGQTYVALSRSRSLSGIGLKRKIFKSDFIVDRRVLDFMNGKFVSKTGVSESIF
jgi:ATP-dependent exoDNAse (exonuclease V) alpha subunit